MVVFRFIKFDVNREDMLIVTFDDLYTNLCSLF